MSPLSKAGVRTGSRPAVAVIEPGVVRKERVLMPLWVTLTGIALRGLTRAVVLLVRVAVRFWPLTLTGAAVTWLWRTHGPATVERDCPGFG